MGRPWSLVSTKSDLISRGWYGCHPFISRTVNNMVFGRGKQTQGDIIGIGYRVRWTAYRLGDTADGIGSSERLAPFLSGDIVCL